MKFSKNDIIFSCDADEVIYRKTYPLLINKLKNENTSKRAFKLLLNNFLYKPDLLWSNLRFIGPTVAKFGYYRFRKYNQWRYDGDLIDFPAGIHFNWHLTPQEIINKLKTYSHKDLYSKYADIQLIRSSIEQRKYPFDKKEVIIKEVSPVKNPELYPDCFSSHIDKFNYLIK